MNAEEGKDAAEERRDAAEERRGTQRMTERQGLGGEVLPPSPLVTCTFLHLPAPSCTFLRLSAFICGAVAVKRNPYGFTGIGLGGWFLKSPAFTAEIFAGLMYFLMLAFT
jgi:hypothetical protein